MPPPALGRMNSFIEKSWRQSRPSRLEPQKPIISNNPWDVIAWHVWAVMAVAASATLIYLNYTEYAIGGELGHKSTQAETANILGALQLVVKLHELIIVASLIAIARQWIHTTMIDPTKGTVLSLVGAEGSLAQPSFLLSKEYYSAIMYGLHGALSPPQYRNSQEARRRREMLFLAVFLSLGCVVSSLAGPASGVLMIPRMDWFYEKQLTLDSSIDNPGGTHYPNILIPPGYANGVYEWGKTGDPFTSEGFGQVERMLESWRFYCMRRMMFLAVKRREMQHRYEDQWGQVTLNTSTTWNRTLGSTMWAGNGTTIRTTMRNSILHITSVLLSREHEINEGKEYEMALTKWAGRKYIGNSGALEVKAECHLRPLVPCVLATGSDWCYTSPTGGTATRSIHNLILLGQGNLPARAQAFVYLTEGTKSPSDPKLVTSMEVVLSEKKSPGFGSPNFIFNETSMVRTPAVIACSLSARIKSAAATSFDIAFTGDYADYADYQVLANGTHEAAQPVLFHQHWLESITDINPTDSKFGSPITATGNVSFGAYRRTIRPSNPILQSFAKTLIEPYEARMNYTSWNWTTIEAAELEVVLGGAFASVLLYLPPAKSQYVLPPTLKISNPLLPLPRYYEHPTNFTLEVYNLGYGFRLSTRTGKLGIVVLVTHSILAVFGSLWQLLRWRRIIKAWRSVPEYLALGIGSPSNQETLDDTCVGISGMRTLQTVVRIEERYPDHLEVSAGDQEFLAMDKEDPDEEPTGESDSASAITAVLPLQPILKRFGAVYGSKAYNRQSHAGR